MRRLLPLLIVGVLLGYTWWRLEHRNAGRVAQLGNGSRIRVLLVLPAPITKACLWQTMGTHVAALLPHEHPLFHHLPTLARSGLLLGFDRFMIGRKSEPLFSPPPSSEGHPPRWRNW